VAAEQREALSRQHQAVEAALDKLPLLLRQSRWREAETVLDGADRSLVEASLADLRRRATQARSDLNLAVRLDAIRLRRVTFVEGRFDYQTADEEYAAALAEAGVAGQGDEDEAAARVRDSAIREHLVAALDDWAASTPNGARRLWLLGVARRADPDDWRDRFRDPKVWLDWAALEGLANDLLKDDGVKLKTQPPTLLRTLGAALRSQKGDPLPLLMEARRRFPSDFWLNFDLGVALDEAKKWGEAAGYYRAALALRPETVAVYNNLGNALRACLNRPWWQ
jgi:serine/threonine-protein kinase